MSENSRGFPENIPRLPLSIKLMNIDLTPNRMTRSSIPGQHFGYFVIKMLIKCNFHLFSVVAVYNIICYYKESLRKVDGRMDS